VSDLLAYLRARLAEDEAVARRATEGPWRYNPRKAWHSPPPRFGMFVPAEEFVAAGPLTDPLCVAATGPADNLESMADAEHIARWDPARALAEVEAKRAILDRYEDAVSRQSERDYSTTDALTQAEEYEDWVIPALVQPYADRPDFNPEWR
jgi:hypothetical protein